MNVGSSVILVPFEQTFVAALEQARIRDFQFPSFDGFGFVVVNAYFNVQVVNFDIRFTTDTFNIPTNPLAPVTFDAKGR